MHHVFKNLQEYFMQNMLTKFHCSSTMFYIFIYLHCPVFMYGIFNDGACSTDYVALNNMVIN
jgi:hypothetical protein